MARRKKTRKDKIKESGGVDPFEAAAESQVESGEQQPEKSAEELAQESAADQAAKEALDQETAERKTAEEPQRAEAITRAEDEAVSDAIDALGEAVADQIDRNEGTQESAVEAPEGQVRSVEVDGRTIEYNDANVQGIIDQLDLDLNELTHRAFDKLRDDMIADPEKYGFELGQDDVLRQWFGEARAILDADGYLRDSVVIDGEEFIYTSDELDAYLEKIGLDADGFSPEEFEEAAASFIASYSEGDLGMSNEKFVEVVKAMVQDDSDIIDVPIEPPIIDAPKLASTERSAKSLEQKLKEPSEPEAMRERREKRELARFAQDVAGANTADDLYKALAKISIIKGSSGSYTGDQVAEIMREVQGAALSNPNIPLKDVPRIFEITQAGGIGLRDKFGELLHRNREQLREQLEDFVNREFSLESEELNRAIYDRHVAEKLREAEGQGENEFAVAKLKYQAFDKRLVDAGIIEVKVDAAPASPDVEDSAVEKFYQSLQNPEFFKTLREMKDRAEQGGEDDLANEITMLLMLEGVDKDQLEESTITQVQNTLVKLEGQFASFTDLNEEEIRQRWSKSLGDVLSMAGYERPREKHDEEQPLLSELKDQQQAKKQELLDKFQEMKDAEGDDKERLRIEYEALKQEQQELIDQINEARGEDWYKSQFQYLGEAMSAADNEDEKQRILKKIQDLQNEMAGVEYRPGEEEIATTEAEEGGEGIGAVEAGVAAAIAAGAELAGGAEAGGEGSPEVPVAGVEAAPEAAGVDVEESIEARTNRWEIERQTKAVTRFIDDNAPVISKAALGAGLAVTATVYAAKKGLRAAAWTGRASIFGLKWIGNEVVSFAKKLVGQESEEFGENPKANEELKKQWEIDKQARERLEEKKQKERDAKKDLYKKQVAALNKRALAKSEYKDAPAEDVDNWLSALGLDRKVTEEDIREKYFELYNAAAGPDVDAVRSQLYADYSKIMYWVGGGGLRTKDHYMRVMGLEGEVTQEMLEEKYNELTDAEKQNKSVQKAYKQLKRRIK